MSVLQSVPVPGILKLGAILILTCLPLAGCRDQSPHSPGNDVVVLQTDWFPQPEHGGFYQALAKGFYEEEGLNVTILPGGPNAMSTQKVLTGRAHFAMNRADTIYSLVNRDVPILMVMATLQHDPQGIMMHESNAVNNFRDLDGKSVMAIPGLMWIDWLEAKYGIKLNIIPHDFGMERFLNDPDFIQQCLVTNEPFYIKRAGVEVKVLPLRESGFDPYHGVYCLSKLADSRPDLVERFVTASVRGWKDFILGDPAPAFALIAEANPKMNQEFMLYSYEAMQTNHLVTGESKDGSQVGQLDPQRMDQLVRELEDLALMDPPRKNQPVWYTSRFLPMHADGPADAPP